MYNFNNNNTNDIITTSIYLWRQRSNTLDLNALSRNRSRNVKRDGASRLLQRRYFEKTSNWRMVDLPWTPPLPHWQRGALSFLSVVTWNPEIIFKFFFALIFWLASWPLIVAGRTDGGRLDNCDAWGTSSWRKCRPLLMASFKMKRKIIFKNCTTSTKHVCMDEYSGSSLSDKNNRVCGRTTWRKREYGNSETIKANDDLRSTTHSQGSSLNYVTLWLLCWSKIRIVLNYTLWCFLHKRYTLHQFSNQIWTQIYHLSIRTFVFFVVYHHRQLILSAMKYFQCWGLLSHTDAAGF